MKVLKKELVTEKPTWVVYFNKTTFLVIISENKVYRFPGEGLNFRPFLLFPHRRPCGNR